MSIARKDDRHNEDLVSEIADSFNREIGEKKTGEENAEAKPRFVITGDSRATPPPRRRER
ncbi:hypothetical protein [Amycolatopsis samaneae]|uniref:Uncharacterized protein n=1 Tax=Amycolatopsis samaneae TaxID=664691 RepID=A0ABW5GKN6_9PSEU